MLTVALLIRRLGDCVTTKVFRREPHSFQSFNYLVHMRSPTWRIFSRCSSCSQHAPVHRFPSWATSRGLLNFWIPVGIVPTSRALPFTSVRLDSLCTTTSPFPPDPRITQRVPILFQHRARAVNPYPITCFKPMSPFHYFLYITNPLLSSFILSVDPLSRVIKRDEPKGSFTPRLLHFRFLYCSLSLRSSIQRTSFHTIPHQ